MSKRICIIGSGNWGSAIARIVGANVKRHPNLFQLNVKMWVMEEMVNGEKLTSIINTRHENVKYLPGQHIPDNIVAVPDIVDAAEDADLLVFVVPHQFISSSCAPLMGQLKPGAKGISLVKGFSLHPEGGIRLISSLINELLDIPISVLMGANIANEVANEMFCETTIGCSDSDEKSQVLLKSLFSTPNFRVTVVNDSTTVELCGALKNIVACGAGFVDGLSLGDNTKAAVIRLGLMEMIRFTEIFFSTPNSSMSTFLESCGVADLITTCYGGRNRRVSEAFVKTKKSFVDLEKEMLGGQKLQGPETAAEVNFMLKQRDMESKFPLFTSVHQICMGEKPVEEFIDDLRNHPEHMIAANAHL